MHNFLYTDKVVLKQINENNLTKLFVKQGYTNCSIAVISEKSAIVTDKKIAEVLRKNGIDVLHLSCPVDIKLFGEENKYSTMKGFIGGAMTKIDDKIIIFGELKKIDPNNEIRKFIESYHMKIIDFKGLDVIDYGGIIYV